MGLITNGEEMDQKSEKWENFWNKLGTVIMAVTCLLTPASILYKNPQYLYSTTGYADGGDLYSHFAEANHIKEQLQDGIVNFWFNQVSLGYPMFTAYHPLPSFFIAIVMVITERFLSPLLVFRLVFVLVLTLIPASLYKSSKCFGLKPMHQISLCLMSFAIQSWRMFGLEITAFVEYGLLTQAFGMLLVFPSVSLLYQWILIDGCKKDNKVMLILAIALIFLTNFFFGILTCILAGAMMIVKILQTKDNAKISFQKVRIFLEVLFRSMALISWWIFACVWGYKYIGGLPWRGESEDGFPLPFLADKFTEGEIFDSHRFFPMFTVLVIIGITLHVMNMTPRVYGIAKCSEAERAFSIWILLSTGLSLILFLGRTTFSAFYNLIPLHTELEAIKYLSAIHFCGLLHASYALSRIFYKLSNAICTDLSFSDIKGDFVTEQCKPFSCFNVRVKFLEIAIRCGPTQLFSYLAHKKKTLVNLILAMLLSCFLWSNQFETIGSRLTMTEVKDDFIEKLGTMKIGTVEGRMLGHRGFGSANSFNLAMLPIYTGKPGLMTYSRGYHDSLSVFYMESIKFNPGKTQLFANMLRLYNVHFVVTSNIGLDEAFSKACQLKHIATIDEFIFYEALHEENDYGYFDFVRIPGYIKGDLKLIRNAVLSMLELYNVNSLLMINPTENLVVNENVVANVKSMSLWKEWQNAGERNVQVTWSSNGIETDSEVLLDNVIKSDSWKWIYSQVIEERFIGVEYQAIVHVTDRGGDPTDLEHLLLKVTYHPFWKCFYYPVSRDFVLDMFNSSRFLDGKIYADVNHVTPNLMSVSLPPGRYLVVFTYRFPGILKILAFFCGCWYMQLLLRVVRMRKTTRNVSTGRLEDGENIGQEYQMEEKCRSNVPYSANVDDGSSVLRGVNDNEKRFRSLRESIYEKASAENLTGSKSNLDLNHNGDSMEDGNGVAKAWKITGRLRSHSIAAENMLKNDALNLLSAMPAAQAPPCLSPCFSEESGEWIDLTGKESDKGKNRSVSSVRSDSDVRSDNPSSRSTSKSGSSDDSMTVYSKIRRQRSTDKNLSEKNSNSDSLSSEISVQKPKRSLEKHREHVKLDANSNLLGTACELTKDSSVTKRSQQRVAAILQSNSSDSSDDDCPSRMSDLRSKLEKLSENEDNAELKRKNRGEIVRELRQTYLRQRRNTLSALPSLRK